MSAGLSRPGRVNSRFGALELLDDGVGELLQVVRLAAGDPVPIPDHRFVLHRGSDLPQVVLDRLPGSQGPALDQVRRDQELRAMADRRDRLPRLIELLHELDHPPVGAQVIRRLTAGDEQGVVVLRLDLIDRFLDLHLLLALVALQLLTGLHTDDVDLVALLLQPVVRNAELRVLETLSQDASDSHGHSSMVLPGRKMRAAARAWNPGHMSDRFTWNGRTASCS